MKNFLNQYNYVTYGLLLIIFAGLLLIIYFKNKRLKYVGQVEKLRSKLLLLLKSADSLESSLAQFLYIINLIITVPSFAVYMPDEKNSSLVLKFVRQSNNDDGKIQPSYSGLLPYNKEVFLLPSSLSKQIVPKEIMIKKEGEVPLLFAPINEKSVAILGPINSISKEKKQLIDSVVKAFEPMLNVISHSEALAKEASVATTSQNAVKNISGIFTDFGNMFSIVLNVIIKTINAQGGMILTYYNGETNIETIIGLDEDTEENIINDASVPVIFDKLASNEQIRKISKKDKEFFSIPPYFVANNAEAFLVVRVPSKNIKCISVFWYDNNPSMKEYQAKVLQVMMKRLEDILDYHMSFKKMSNSYIDILKMIAKLTDNIKPSTVGYSELMYRYALIVSKELQLDAKDIKDIALAAFLSNIGIIGMSDELLFKTGKYSDIEFEKMKLHAEAGASIIEATIGNSNVALYIKHHHERMDGFGYPSGLKGDEIPLGSRIILVIQTFLAKIIARDYRPALSFEDALMQLKSATGTQLDRRVVDALINWFVRKQKSAFKVDGPLGRCWDMRCSPENVCINCPAYNNPIKKCWEINGVNCLAHGNECNNCFIRTEYVWRHNKK